MSKVKVKLPDGWVKEYDNGVRVVEVLAGLDEPACEEVLAAKVNGRLVDLPFPLKTDADLKFVTFEDEEGKEVYWHSTSHIMAQAVKELFAGVKLAIGPAIADGFYYDFDWGQAFTPGDLEKIEERMGEIIAADLSFERWEFSKSEALKYLEERGEKYKVELVEEMPKDEVISFYRQGDFVDMCEGPHVPSTGRIGAFKLLRVSGAYWRGDEHNPMLQRIYGISFPTAEALDEYLAKLAEAGRRDHRRLGKSLDLFSLHEEMGPGLALWYPDGAVVRKVIEDFWVKEHERRGYQVVYTPHIAKVDLWERSGHTEFYKEFMFFLEVEKQKYVLKPMNCPGHILIYKSHTRSYKDLPIRYAELGTVYRYERSGVLHGLLRVRGFTQDDAHIFCTQEQLKPEIKAVVKFACDMLEAFGFDDYKIYLSTRPEEYAGDLKDWDRAEGTLREVLEELGLKYEVDAGAAVFYGPKIDIHLKDCLGRLHQASTIQFDFNLPARFEVTYVGSDGREHLVYMVHRAILGSLERFMATLTEHYAGAFPTWLAPLQVLILPISDRHLGYAQEVRERLVSGGLRVEMDGRNEKMGIKIAEAESRKVPYMIVVGDREIKEGNISVRRRGREDLGIMGMEEFMDKIKAEVKAQ